MALSHTEREQIIQAILASGSGIFGTAVCQLCGQLGTYSGWAQAMSGHHDGEFVCWAHGHVEPEERGGVRSYGPVELARGTRAASIVRGAVLRVVSEG